MILVPLPDHPYYLWQALVQAVWLRDRGWPVTFLVYLTGPRISSRLQRLMGSGLGEWVAWDEWRPVGQCGYNAAMKPGLVGRWLSAYSQHADESHLVVDPDCLPLRQWPDASPGVLYGTDTDSYTGSRYLRSKNAWRPLCDLVGVDPDQAAGYRGIGAQYVTSGLSGAWWEEVAEVSAEAFRMLEQIPAPPGDAYPVQAWCAEMYVTQLMAIRDGITPTVHPDMSMVWANGPRTRWDTEGFFHDAGQQVDDGKHFFKCGFQSSPWGVDLQVDPASSSAPYVDLIRRVAIEFPELVW